MRDIVNNVYYILISKTVIVFVKHADNNFVHTISKIF